MQIKHLAKPFTVRAHRILESEPHFHEDDIDQGYILLVEGMDERILVVPAACSNQHPPEEGDYYVDFDDALMYLVIEKAVFECMFAPISEVYH